MKAPGRSCREQHSPRHSVWRAPLFTAATALAGTAVVATVDPGTPGRYPTCPWLGLTGTHCPLCGGLRSVHALTTLDVPTSLSYNILTIPILLSAVIYWIVWMRRAGRGDPLRPAVPGWALWTAATIGLVFGVLRNLPPFAGLAPPG